MPYIGKQLSNGNYLKLDDISSQFNGSKVTFSLTNGGSAYYPGSEFSILVSVGGVIQEPESAYQISNDEITFANAPTAQDSFFCVVLGDAIGINVPGNNTVNGEQMAKPFNYDGGLLYLDDANNKVGINSTSPSVALDIIGDLNVSGTITGIVTSGGSGISTFYNLNVENNATIDGNLTVNGTTTTLDTVLTEVDKLEVAANNSTVGVAITQSGSGDILNLYDGSTEVFSVADGGTATFAGAIDANGDLDVDGHTNLDNVSVVGLTTFTKVGATAVFNSGAANDGRLEFQYNNSRVGLLAYHSDRLEIQTDSSKDFTIRTSGANERLRITSTGLVGIATVNPLSPLDIHGANSNAHIRLTESAYTNTNKFTKIMEYGGTTYFQSRNDTNNGSFIFRGENASSTPEFLRITSAGKVGIGTEIPATTLDVQGDVAVAYNATHALRFYTQPRNNWSSITNTATDGNANLSFRTSQGEAMYMSYGRLVGIGTNNPVGNLEVRNTKANLIVAKTGLTVKGNSDLHTSYDLIQLGAGGALASYSTATATADTQFIHNAYRHSGGNWKYRYADTAMKLRMNSPGRTFIFESAASGSADGDITFSEQLRITSGGNLKLPDNAKIELGGVQTGSGDLQIYHDADSSYIEHTTSGTDLVIDAKSPGDDLILKAADDVNIRVQGNETAINCIGDGGVQLFYDASVHTTAKLQTTATGVTVTGEVASTQDYPTQRPTLDFNFIRTKTLDSIFTYQRLGAASFVNEQGLVELVGDNTPRFDHDPVTRECKGLLLEETRSNLIYPSSDWSEDYWTINNSGSLSRDTHNGDTKDPAGTYTATKLVTLASNTNTKDIWWTKSNITYTNGSKYAVSCFAKSTTGLHLQLRPRGQSSNRAWATYNLTTGVVGNSGGTTLVSTKIEKYPNGWYRCSLVFTGSGNSSCSLGTLIMDDGNDAEAVSHTGDGSKSIYLWGAQIELSNTVTSYIPTVFHAYDLTAIKTRGEDDLRIHGTEFTDFYNPMESTICMSFTHLDTSANIGTNARVYRFRSTNTSSDTRIDYLSHPYYHPFIAEDGNQPTGGTGLDAGTLLYEGQVNKTAVKVKENDFGSCLNGGSVAVDTNGGWNPSNAFNEVSLGSSNGAATTLLMGHIQRFTYYPVALPDNQLKTLTS